VAVVYQGRELLPQQVRAFIDVLVAWAPTAIDAARVTPIGDGRQFGEEAAQPGVRIAEAAGERSHSEPVRWSKPCRTARGRSPAAPSVHSRSPASSHRGIMPAAKRVASRKPSPHAIQARQAMVYAGPRTAHPP
jgi:hypothetical protein